MSFLVRKDINQSVNVNIYIMRNTSSRIKGINLCWQSLVDIFCLCKRSLCEYAIM